MHLPLSFLVLLLTQAATITGLTCNGRSELCPRLYSNVTQIGTHDSAFVGPSPFDNQDVSVTAQLDAGIRFLQAQVHDLLGLGTLYLCHTSCAARNAGTLEKYLVTVKTWLDAHPDDVVTLLLTNADFVDVSLFARVFERVGLDDLAYAPGKKLAVAEWPSLQTLIESGKRLVMFLDYQADTSKAAYILPEFDYFFETPYNGTDAAFAPASCALDRPPGLVDDGRMYIVNHLLQVEIDLLDVHILIPDRLRAHLTNAATGPGSVGAQADTCRAVWQRRPNLVLVDFFDVGDVFTAQATLNGF
ncbi:hypothetical protein PVAG01_03366 [Phlyctema vagabunda]|uniref:PLC-like phosphodiesterase n=1 Tax=Phlyctema vagabunda TaxID=108571 RepID=A0ABR4PLB0_9HELO